MDNDDFKDEIALAFAKSPDTAHDLDNIDNDTFKAEEALALEKGRDTTQVLPKFFDKEVGISPDEQAAIEEFADKIKNDPVLRTKLGIEFQRKPDYAVLKEDFLHPVEMQF